MIFSLCCKYLKSLENIKTISTETARAYSTDLAQAFDLKNLKNWKNCNLDQFIDNAAADKRVDEQVLIGLLRRAQSGWDGLAPASRRRKAACLKSFLSWLYENQITVTNLAFKIVLTKIPQKIPRFLSVDEIISLLKRLIKDAQEEKTGEKRHAYVLVLLLYGAGLRVSEACKLLWQDVNLSRRSLKVTGKGKKERQLSAPKMVF